MQRDVLHDHAADADRFELADRRERAGAADLDFDIPQHGHGALGREFMRDRPARRARDEAEPFLPVDAVDLVDHAVDVVVEMRAPGLDLAMKTQQFLHRVAKPGQRIGREAAPLEPFDHAGLGIGRHRGHLAPGIGEETQRTRGGDAGVLLAQRAGRRIARIGEDRVAGRLLPFVQREKRLLGHIDLAAHLADLRHVAAFEFLRHVLQRSDVGGDVFAHGAVAACGGGDEFAALVAQRHRQAIDLRLGAEADAVVVAELEEAADARSKVEHILFGKGVVERQHRHRMPDLGKAPGRLRADFLRRRFAGDEFGKSLLDRVEALPQRIVFGVRDARRVVLIVTLVVPLKLQRQPLQLDLGLGFGKLGDVGERFCLCGLGCVSGHGP